jgi:hypothetical protein
MSDLQELKDGAARIDIFWSGSSETVEQAKTDHQKGCADADGVSELHAAVFSPPFLCFFLDLLQVEVPLPRPLLVGFIGPPIIERGWVRVALAPA